MIVTEEEAASKQCQETFGPQPAQPVCNYPLTTASMMSGHYSATTYTASITTCIASQCMAWRWFDNTNDQAIKEPRGYCGKAGAP